MTARVLYTNHNIQWTKDRRAEQRTRTITIVEERRTFTGIRVNDGHLANAVKVESRMVKGARL